MQPEIRRVASIRPVLEAMERWRADASADAMTDLSAAIGAAAASMGLTVGRLRATAPPLPDLELDVGGGIEGAEIALRMPGEARPVGWARIGGDPHDARAFAEMLELAIASARTRAAAERTDRQLVALDQAVRGIGGVLDVARVLQVIVDRVRDLAPAQYAAIGIVDSQGGIEQFITSGISGEDRARIGDLPRGHGLLGLIIRESRTYRIPDIGAHPERFGFPAHHPEMRSFLGMPITVGGNTVGRLYLTNKIGAAEFSADDQALVEMFALHAGIAIENARLHDQVGRLAVVDERDRISRDLHDSVIQAIYAQTLALDDVPEMIPGEPEAAARRVDDAIDALHAVIRDIRNFIFGLRPVLLEAGGITEGLHALGGELRRSSGVTVEVRVGVDESELALPIETVADLLAVAREGLSNVARHAGATQARIELDRDGADLRLVLTDDGRGFDAAEHSRQGHQGLANMRARIEALGGRFGVESSPTHGTRIIMSVPETRPRSPEPEHD
ncbi:MAG: GAF domain-containing sensor histidine kinase [Chloroflexi bacterium]|nr:GAF domain-containing sensor histidine kinase [Chloroflexota bacterium]